MRKLLFFFLLSYSTLSFSSAGHCVQEGQPTYGHAIWVCPGSAVCFSSEPQVDLTDACPVGDPIFYDPLASPPSSNTPPWGAALAAAAAALGLALLGGIGGLVGVPLLAAISASGAAHLAVVAALSILSASTPQAVVDAVNPPVRVVLDAPTAAPVPANMPSVSVDPLTNKFVPGGGNLDGGTGATGDWSPKGATGEWEYMPKPTADNPAPKPIAVITDGGKVIVQQVNPDSSGFSTKSLVVTRYSDGTIDITGTAQVPVSTSSGLLSTLGVSTSNRYSSASSPSSAAPIVHTSDTLGKWGIQLNAVMLKLCNGIKDTASAIKVTTSRGRLPSQLRRIYGVVSR